MKRLSVLLLATVLVAAFPLTAVAAQTVVLGFGASYLSAAGESRTHHGIDLAATPGDTVPTPAAGTVRFVGRVPAAGGGTCLAVTVDSDFGRVTLMPLDSAAVTVGDAVVPGESVGRLAASGDGSSEQPHLHLGLRHGDLYVDPSVLLMAEPTSGTEPETKTQPVSAQAPVSARALGAQAAAAPAQLAEGVSLAPTGAQAPSPATVPEGALQAGTSARRAREGRMAQLPRGVSVVPASAAAAVPVAATSPLARLGDAAALQVLRSAASLGAVAPVTLAGLAVLVAGCVLMLSRRAFERRFTASTSVSHRWAILLQQLRAGDTLRGLTSCSGGSAFTVPGPFSPEEVTK